MSFLEKKIVLVQIYSAISKALLKQEGPNVYSDAPFLNLLFCSMQPIKIQKKDLKNGEYQQTFGPSHFVRALNPKTKQEMVFC